jgi:hypothetical protein
VGTVSTRDIRDLLEGVLDPPPDALRRENGTAIERFERFLSEVKPGDFKQPVFESDDDREMVVCPCPACVAARTPRKEPS